MVTKLAKIFVNFSSFLNGHCSSGDPVGGGGHCSSGPLRRPGGHCS